jgi:hypothetical protein
MRVALRCMPATGCRRRPRQAGQMDGRTTRRRSGWCCSRSRPCERAGCEPPFVLHKRRTRDPGRQSAARGIRMMLRGSCSGTPTLSSGPWSRCGSALLGNCWTSAPSGSTTRMATPMPIEGVRETMRLHGSKFNNWLTASFCKQGAKVAPDQSVREAIFLLPAALILQKHQEKQRLVLTLWSLRQESNLYLPLRRRPFYPLNYGEDLSIVAAPSTGFGLGALEAARLPSYWRV